MSDRISIKTAKIAQYRWLRGLVVLVEHAQARRRVGLALRGEVRGLRRGRGDGRGGLGVRAEQELRALRLLLLRLTWETSGARFSEQNTIENAKNTNDSLIHIGRGKFAKPKLESQNGTSAVSVNVTLIPL